MSAADNAQSDDLGVFDTGVMLSLLMERAAPHLTGPELEWLSQARLQACSLASNAEAVADGIGCLISNDGSDSGMAMGSFQSRDDLPQLLFHFGGVFGQIRALLNVSGAVESRQMQIQIQCVAANANQGGAA